MPYEDFTFEVREVHQAASGGSHVVKYLARVQWCPHEAGVAVEVLSVFPEGASPSDVQLAAECIRRGAEAALRPFHRGALIQLERLFIHPVDFKPAAFERYTERELSLALAANATTP
jgi:hypothetical protein